MHNFINNRLPIRTEAYVLIADSAADWPDRQTRESLWLSRIPSSIRTKVTLVVAGLLLASSCFALTQSSSASQKPIPWSFKQLKEVTPPSVKAKQWPVNSIDQFILSKLESLSLEPAGDAEPYVLIRRLSFDLLGLPPSTELIERYVANPSKVNFSKIVQEMLDSRAFGERWARQWFDLVRFAESTGKDRNYAFPEAWRYRDWVINAINRDLPYNRFIIAQLAGDLLSANSPTELDDNVTATAFLALGPKGLNESRRAQFLMDLVDEQIDVTTRAFLGITFACARCHDHKSDPFTQENYYALAGVFDSTETYYGTVSEQGNRQPSALIPLQSVTNHLSSLPETPKLGGGNSDSTEMRMETLTLQEKRMNGMKRGAGVTNNAGFSNLPSQANQPSVRRGRREERRLLPPGPPPGTPRTMGVKDGTARNMPILVRGEISQRGAVVRRAVLSLPGGDAPIPAKIPADQSGRIQLANWITTPDNPLTARVQVNRVWQTLFGKGIVHTPDDFGNEGSKPIHPELLDWLAAEFVKQGWSLKSLVKLIVESRTYQLSDLAPKRLKEVDPDNHYFGYRTLKRLEAEALRDALLMVSGMLDASPAEGSPVSSMGDGRISRSSRSDRTPSLARKRSIYLPVIRGMIPESLEIFDFPDPSLITPVRDNTNVPIQSLHLMNHESVITAAKGLALKLTKSGGDSTKKIEHAFQWVFGRNPTPIEMDQALAFVQRGLRPVFMSRFNKRQSNSDLGAPWIEFCQALLITAEFRWLR